MRHTKRSYRIVSGLAAAWLLLAAAGCAAPSSGTVSQTAASQTVSAAASEESEIVSSAASKASPAVSETVSVEASSDTMLYTGSLSGQIVWIPTNGGKKYHANPSCSNMIDPVELPVEEAAARGFEPCARCHPGEQSSD